MIFLQFGVITVCCFRLQFRLALLALVSPDFEAIWGARCSANYAELFLP